MTHNQKSPLTTLRVTVALDLDTAARVLRLRECFAPLRPSLAHVLASLIRTHPILDHLPAEPPDTERQETPPTN